MAIKIKSCPYLFWLVIYFLVKYLTQTVFDEKEVEVILDHYDVYESCVLKKKIHFGGIKFLYTCMDRLVSTGVN